MDQEQGSGRAALGNPVTSDTPALLLDRHFVAEPYRQVEDAAERRTRLAAMLAGALVPRLERFRAVIPLEHPTSENVAELARLVLGPDEGLAADYVTDLREQGLPVDALFGELLEPAAQLLGQMWDQDDIDFIDVTLGVARLQAILWLFHGKYPLQAVSDCRLVLMLTPDGEQHSFGIAMVEKCLEAGGWDVISERGPSPERLIKLVRENWIAVAGIALSNRDNLPAVADLIATIRKHSRNKAIGVMVGGPVFSAEPAQASVIGADGTAVSGPTAVVLAQKLLDQSLLSQSAART